MEWSSEALNIGKSQMMTNVYNSPLIEVMPLGHVMWIN